MGFGKNHVWVLIRHDSIEYRVIGVLVIGVFRSELKAKRALTNDALASGQDRGEYVIMEAVLE